jgi:CheY-like chemotaxis protein
MDKIKLLIVDDVEDNRLVLRAICRKLEGFEIYEAVDGRDAVDQCETLRPHIILMDVMMPRLDGFQASKLIKERYPDTIIMAVTAVIDPKMEENMASIGVAAYIRKPIDKELIRLKLQSYAGALSIEGREKKLIANVVAINPFSDEIRNFKTIFDIHSIEAIMDFGMWLLVRFECAHAKACTNIDRVIELLYELLNQEIKSGATMTITIEESFDELFIHTPLPKHVQRDVKIEHLIRSLGDACLIIHENMAAFRLQLSGDIRDTSPISIAVQPSNLPSETKISIPEIKQSQENEVRAIGAIEHQVLRESFVHKVTAKEYVASIDSDAFGEVSDLREAQAEWTSWMQTLEHEGSEESFSRFANDTLGAYSNAISALYEFSGLAYAMISLSNLIKSNAAVLAHDQEKRAQVILFLEGFKNDIASWIDHVFVLQDAQDIHYLDGSFFSSCMIIESVITGVDVDIGDEGEIEFF